MKGFQLNDFVNILTNPFGLKKMNKNKKIAWQNKRENCFKQINFIDSFNYWTEWEKKTKIYKSIAIYNVYEQEFFF